MTRSRRAGERGPLDRRGAPTDGNGDPASTDSGAQATGWLQVESAPARPSRPLRASHSIKMPHRASDMRVTSDVLLRVS